MEMNNQQKLNQNMEDYDLLKCVDKALDKFGTSVKQTIYWKITILHGSLQNAIVENPSIFIGVLHDIFRDSSIGVERSIIEEIRSAFTFVEGEVVETLGDALKLAKEQITPTTSLLVHNLQTTRR
jgi:hypothetical protein